MELILIIAVSAAVWRRRRILGSYSRLLVTVRVPCALARAGTLKSTEANPAINNPARSSRAARGAQSSELTVLDTLAPSPLFQNRYGAISIMRECAHPRDALAVSRSRSAVFAPSKPCKTASCLIGRRVRIAAGSPLPVQPEHFTHARRVSGALGGRNSPRVPSHHFTLKLLLRVG
jgi:hypothetical protein